MSLLENLPLGPIVTIVAIVVAVLLVGLVFAKNYIKVPPNTVAVFTGRGTPKIVHGGARLRIPGIERVDTMGLEPFNVDVRIEDVYTRDGVPITVTGVGLIKFGSDTEALKTAVERFLTSDRNDLHRQVQEILAGSLRNIVSQGTVEELNSGRDELRRHVTDEAAESFGRIGMVLDVLTIQSISDKVNYLVSLGKRRTAEVQRDATIGEAEAKRDADIRSAAARQEGEVAQAAADQVVADARQKLDLRRASIQEEVDAAKARAAQAGPLAEAEAQRAVVLAGVTTEQRRMQAQIAVEEQRAARAQQATQADVVIPAEAARQAAIARAEGEKAAAIAKAEAEARQLELQGEAEAVARTRAAQATQRELEATAAGEKASLLARAEGQRELAAATNAVSDASLRVQALPLLMQMLPQLAEKLAAPMGNVDKIVLVDNGGSNDGGNAVTRFASSTVAAMPQVEALLGAFGIDLSSMFGDNKSGDNATTNGTAPLDAKPAPHPRDELPAG